MANSDDEIDRVTVQTVLFALITARFEDAHGVAVSGQSRKNDLDETASYVEDLNLVLEEVRILTDAIFLVNQA